MAENLDLLGVIGTWMAVFLAIVALAGIIPAYILYRASQTEQYEALSQIDDKNHDYISKGYTLLPGNRFFRKIRVPNLTQLPELAEPLNGAAEKTETQPTIRRNCALFDREGSPSSTAWVNFANLLRAYDISPPFDRRDGKGKLKIAGSQALLPVHRNWILLLGIVDRYSCREDLGLFVDELSEPEWSAFGSGALYGLSGVLDIDHDRSGHISGNQSRHANTLCFRMHSIAHMRSMPAYIPARDLAPRTLFFLYLGYLPGPDGSLFCSALESGRTDRPVDIRGVSRVVPRTYENPHATRVYYKMEVLESNEVPVRDKRLAQEMRVCLPKVRRLSIERSAAALDEDWVNEAEYMCLDETVDRQIWLPTAGVQAMVLAALRFDLNAQSFLCGEELRDLFLRLLSPDEPDYLFHTATRDHWIDALQIRDADRTSLRTAIDEVARHEPLSIRSTHTRRRALALAALDDTLRTLRQHYTASRLAMDTVAILYLTNKTFRSILVDDYQPGDPQPMFSIDVAGKKAHLPAMAHQQPVSIDVDFQTVFSGTVEEKQGENAQPVTIPLWQVMMASLHGLVRWHTWPAVFSSHDLSTFHTPLDRIVHVSPQDLPNPREYTGTGDLFLQAMVHALRGSNREHDRSHRSANHNPEQHHGYMPVTIVDNRSYEGEDRYDRMPWHRGSDDVRDDNHYVNREQSEDNYHSNGTRSNDNSDDGVEGDGSSEGDLAAHRD
ncbi:hypothetical protein BDW74DRAFT_178225 [Aspergillus multicolor]|uniref:uncharacterized protein n=1 Tax=Aspergillus multicolor TaxID=41759 RepID=UPI003CCD325F